MKYNIVMLCYLVSYLFKWYSVSVLILAVFAIRVVIAAEIKQSFGLSCEKLFILLNTGVKKIMFYGKLDNTWLGAISVHDSHLVSW